MMIHGYEGDSEKLTAVYITDQARNIFNQRFEIRSHGEWIEKHCDYGVYYRCSNCHKMPPNYECDYKEGAIKTNFCPNCGADMRKKGEAE